MKVNVKHLREKAGLDPSWSVASVATTTWQGLDSNGNSVPVGSTKVTFEKTEQVTAEFTRAA